MQYDPLYHSSSIGRKPHSNAQDFWTKNEGVTTTSALCLATVWLVCFMFVRDFKFHFWYCITLSTSKNVLLHGTSLLLIKPKIEDQFLAVRRDREAKGCLYPITYALRYTETQTFDPLQSLLLTQGTAQKSEVFVCLKAPLILRESMKINFKKTVSAWYVAWMGTIFGLW